MHPTCWARAPAKAGAASESPPECPNGTDHSRTPSLVHRIFTQCLLSIGGLGAAGCGSYWWGFQWSGLKFWLYLPVITKSLFSSDPSWFSRLWTVLGTQEWGPLNPGGEPSFGSYSSCSVRRWFLVRHLHKPSHKPALLCGA